MFWEYADLFQYIKATNSSTSKRESEIIKQLAALNRRSQSNVCKRNNNCNDAEWYFIV